MVGYVRTSDIHPLGRLLLERASMQNSGYELPRRSGLQGLFISIKPRDQLRAPNATLGARRFARTSKTAPSEDRLNFYEQRHK
jgi:hypothetical protein